MYANDVKLKISINRTAQTHLPTTQPEWPPPCVCVCVTERACVRAVMCIVSRSSSSTTSIVLSDVVMLSASWRFGLVWWLGKRGSHRQPAWPDTIQYPRHACACVCVWTQKWRKLNYTPEPNKLKTVFETSKGFPASVFHFHQPRGS